MLAVFRLGVLEARAMRCPRCQSESRMGARFCEECGSRLALACRGCGADILPDKRFCGSCGSPVAAQAIRRHSSPQGYTPKHLAEKILTSRTTLEGERKQVTVLFADVKGSMELLADRDPEEARKLLDPVLEHMMEAVHRYEGTVNQIMGDGIMALFGAPLAHEDHAVRACYAALRMQESIRQYGNELQRVGAIAVQVRVGLNSGEVVVRSIRGDLHMDYTAVGQTTHLAARMEQIAAAGSVLVTAETFRLVEGYVQVRPLGTIPVKGVTHPIEAYELTGAEPVRTRLQAAAARGLTRFVGRDADIDEIRRAMDWVARGHGQIVAVVGEPGVGKSRLFWEFTRFPRLHDWLVLESGSVSYGRATLYLPLIDLLKTYFKIQDRDDQREVREKVTGKLLALDRTLEPMLPPLLTLLDVPFEEPQWRLLDPPQRRERTLDACKRLLLRESQVQPLVLVFEDLHWIDGETQAVLDSLVESLPTARILLLVNYRPEYQHAWGNKTYYSQLRVDPLPPKMAEELLDTLLGEDVALTPLKQLLIERTEGNPFFLEENIRTLVETKVLSGERGAYSWLESIATIHVPPTVQAVLDARIDRLPADEKRILQAASVIGKNVPLAILQAVTEVPEDELRQGLAHLRAAEFLYETSLFPELEYSFTHALTQEVAYGSLVHDRRRDLHARILRAIEALSPERLAERVESLAHHAFKGQLWGKALTYLRLAGERAFAHSAQSHAVAWFEQALDALAHIPESRDTIEQAIDLRLELRNALVPLGRFSRVLEVLREAETLAVGLEDQRRLGLVNSFLTNYFQVTGDPEGGIGYGQRALAIALACDDFATEVVATAFLASAHQTLGDYPHAIEFGRRSIKALQGELAYQRFGMANLPSVYSRTTLVRSLAELGEFGEGTSLGIESLQIAEAAEHAVSLTLAWFGIGYLHLRKGDLDHAIPALDRAVELSRVVNRIWFRQIASALSSAYVSAGRLSDALRLLEEADAQAASIGLAGTPLGHGLQLAAHGEALLAAGRVVEAVELALRAADFFRAIKARGHEAWTHYLLGAISAQHDASRRDEAETYLRDALLIGHGLKMQPLVAQCHLELGKLHRQAGRQENARLEMLTATRLFRGMGMTSWTKRAEDQLAKEADPWT